MLKPKINRVVTGFYHKKYKENQEVDLKQALEMEY
jgi:hypothetical protein